MSDLDEEELKATREMKQINKIISPEEKSADEMFEELGYSIVCRNDKVTDTLLIYEKEAFDVYRKEKYIKRIIFYGYKEISCTQNYFYLAQFDLEELQAINKKCKELRMDIKKCKCGNIPEIREYYIKGVANRKNYFVKCVNCMYRTRSRNRKYKAIDEWNEYGAKLFCDERRLNWFND